MLHRGMFLCVNADESAAYYLAISGFRFGLDYEIFEAGLGSEDRDEITGRPTWNAIDHALAQSHSDLPCGTALCVKKPAGDGH